MTITIGYWGIPALLTVAAFLWAHAVTPTPSSGYGADLTGLVTFGAALIFSLLAWLVWAVLT